MDILSLTKSTTRQKLFKLFFSHPQKGYYLREIERELLISAGNIRRELLSLSKSGLFIKYKKGRLIYYQLNTKSTLYQALKILMVKINIIRSNIVSEGFSWINKTTPTAIPSDIYCPTRDVLGVRLESFGKHLENKLGMDAYLITAIAGEIGNNSFDHNLGKWRDDPGIYFAYDEKKQIIVLADRGQGIFNTISHVMPKVKDDKEALLIAFTKHISGRSPEKRGNGLKFVSQILKDKKWTLLFDSGRAELIIDSIGKINVLDVKRNIKGCFTVLRY